MRVCGGGGVPQAHPPCGCMCMPKEGFLANTHSWEQQVTSGQYYASSGNSYYTDS